MHAGHVHMKSAVMPQALHVKLSYKIEVLVLLEDLLQEKTHTRTAHLPKN